MSKEVLYNFYQGRFYMQVPKSLIRDELFAWGDQEFPIGSRFKQLGIRPRTTLCINEDMIYSGMYKYHYLFTWEKQLTKEPKLYLAPVRIDKYSLLMQGNAAGGWDIRVD